MYTGTYNLRHCSPILYRNVLFTTISRHVCVWFVQLIQYNWVQPERIIYDDFEPSWAMRIPERIIYDTFEPTLYRNAFLSAFLAQFIPERIMNQAKCIPERIICDVFSSNTCLSSVVTGTHYLRPFWQSFYGRALWAAPFCTTCIAEHMICDVSWKLHNWSSDLKRPNVCKSSLGVAPGDFRKGGNTQKHCNNRKKVHIMPMQILNLSVGIAPNCNFKVNKRAWFHSKK